MSSKPRRIANRYEVSPLDAGGMATVWQGYDTVLDRVVAIKQIRPDRHDSPELRRELVERFRREARVTAKIEHPGVPAVYDAAIDLDDDDIERLYLVMQFVHGVTLADLLAERGPLPVSWAVSITAQVCTVLSHAHAIPVVHRDLKPSNIMIAYDGSVKVLDFGVAAVLDTGLTKLTETGRVVGSRDYMSPEQFYGVAVTPRSDLYAVGCLLHEMLTGAKVFDSSSDAALQHVHEAPTPVRVLRPDVPVELERLILDLLAKAPDDRPASAADVYQRLVPFLPRSGSTVDGGAGDYHHQLPDPTRPYRRPLAPRATAHPPHRPPDVTPADLPELVATAAERAAQLIEEDRFTQAATVAKEALQVVGDRLPPDQPDLLALRSTHAVALFLGGDYQRALTVLERLADAYERLAGPDDSRTRDVRTQVAYCHAKLGNTEAALAAFRDLLASEQRRTGTLRSSDALELRRQIGILLLAAQRPADAVEVLRPLYEDLRATRAADDTELRDVRDLLTRARHMSGP